MQIININLQSNGFIAVGFENNILLINMENEIEDNYQTLAK
jgi:hypothetical protein